MAGKSRSMFRLKGKLRNTLPVFLVCLLISSLFWVLIAFNGYYSTIIKVPVNYINMPADSFLFEKLPANVELEITGEGYQLITYLLNPEKAALILNGYHIGMSGHPAKGGAFLATVNGIEYFNRLHNDVKAIRSNPDTIFFNFFRQGFRKVPLRIPVSLDFEKGFGLAGTIESSPDSVHISGPAEILNSINYLEGETLKLSGINGNRSYKVKIKSPQAELDYSPAEANVFIPVEKYTEAIFDIPIRAENLIKRDCVDLSPSMIRLSCEVALSRYAALRPDSFQLTIDMKTLRGTKLKVNLHKQPSGVSNIRLKPDYIDCIVKNR
jgi:hypothetical protein